MKLYETKCVVTQATIRLVRNWNIDKFICALILFAYALYSDNEKLVEVKTLYPL